MSVDKHMRTRLGLAGAILLVIAVWGSSLSSQFSGPLSAGVAGEGALFLPAPGGDPEEEGESLRRLNEYWHQRISYPTGNFDTRWLLQAAQQDKAVASGVPAGRVTYN